MHCQRTGVPCFPKVGVLPFYFYERPILVPGFVNQKNSEEDFCFYKKAVTVLVMGLLLKCSSVLPTFGKWEVLFALRYFGF